MTTYNRIAAVTGSNKGIGLACVRQLALQYPHSSYNKGAFLIYLTARNEERGKAALQNILNDPHLKQAGVLTAHGGTTDVKYLPLDIDSSESIDEFAATIKKEHPEGIDILINNAGIALDGFDADLVKKTLHCNYYGTLNATKQLLPHIRDGGRLVNVASRAGQFGDFGSGYSQDIESRFRSSTKVEEVTKLMEEFHAAVSNGSWKSNWPSSAYRVSKAGVIGMTRAIATQNASTGSKTLINSCCPGYVDTDMTKHNGHKTPDQGAQTPVFLALGDIGGKYGEFWDNEQVVSW